MGEQFIVNDAAQDMSDGNVHFLNPGRFGVLYNQRVIAKFLAPSSIPSQEPYGGDAHRLCLLQGMLYVGRVAAGRKAYQNITFRSDVGKHLPVVQDIFFEPDTFLDGLDDIILHNFLISLVQRYDISEMKLAFDEIFKLSLLSPFQSAEESEEYAFFNIESSLLGI